MNLRNPLIAALLLSVAHAHAYNDIDFARAERSICLNNDYECVTKDMPRNAVNETDFLLGLSYCIAQELPSSLSCPFNPKGRAEKAIIKLLINRHVLKNSLDIPLYVSPQGQINLVTTDQVMELADTLLIDLYAHRSGSRIIKDLGLTYAREKIVGAILWAVQQTSVESILPAEISASTLYQQVRNEILRYYSDILVDKVTR